MERVIGIDLGTFNSCVAVVENGTPVVIANRGGYKVTPSMVAVTEGGKRLVGHIAKRQAVTNAENTVFACKRLIGRKWESPQVKNAIQTCPFHIVEGPHGDCRIKMRDKVYSIPEISAMVLQEMKMVAEGVKNAKSVYNLSRKLEVEMPICHETYRILYEDFSPKEAVYRLMTRDLKQELDEQ